MSQIQSLILATQLCGHNGRGDLASYTLSSFDSYERLQDRIVDSFLPKLAAFPGELAGESGLETPELTVELSDELTAEVLQILI